MSAHRTINFLFFCLIASSLAAMEHTQMAPISSGTKTPTPELRDDRSVTHWYSDTATLLGIGGAFGTIASIYFFLKHPQRQAQENLLLEAAIPPFEKWASAIQERHADYISNQSRNISLSALLLAICGIERDFVCTMDATPDKIIRATTIVIKKLASITKMPPVDQAALYCYLTAAVAHPEQPMNSAIPARFMGPSNAPLPDSATWGEHLLQTLKFLDEQTSHHISCEHAAQALAWLRCCTGCLKMCTGKNYVLECWIDDRHLLKDLFVRAKDDPALLPQTKAMLKSVINGMQGENAIAEKCRTWEREQKSDRNWPSLDEIKKYCEEPSAAQSKAK